MSESANAATDLNALANRAADGGNREFADLLNACRSLIGSQIRRIGFRSAIIQRDDLNQIASLAVDESLRNWAPSRASFATFAGRVVRCRLLSAIRSQLPCPDSPTFEPLPDDAEDRFASNGKRQSIPQGLASQEQADHYLRTMTQRDRFIVKDIAEGYTYREAGQRFNLEQFQVKGIVDRARRKNRRRRAAKSQSTDNRTNGGASNAH